MCDTDDIDAKYFGHPRSSPPQNDFEKLTVEYLFGSLYARATDTRIPHPLGFRDRALINVAVLATLGRTAELRQHLEAAVFQGIGYEQLVEVMIHLAHYAGWPAGHSGMKVLKDFRQISRPRVRRPARAPSRAEREHCAVGADAR